MSFKRDTFFFFSWGVIFINTYPYFISVPAVDVFLLNFASLNKKNIINYLHVAQSIKFILNLG